MDEARFRAPPAAELIAAPLDGLVALFHRPSGQTHVVADPVPAIMEAIAAKALTCGELLAKLGVTDPDAEDHAGLLGHLGPLIASGLVEQL